jgi:hypothetical protein
LADGIEFGKAENDGSWTVVDAAIYLRYDYGRLRGLLLRQPPSIFYPFVTMQDRKRNLEELAARYPHLKLVWVDDNV